MANIKSTISFGLVSIPVVYNPVIKNNDITFNQLHKKCLNRIRYQKYCEHCKKVVHEADIVKGYEYEKGEYVTFLKEELGSVSDYSKDIIDIVAFVPEAEIDAYYYEKSYILSTPRKSKAYSLFLEALKRSKRVAIGKTLLSTKFYYVILKYFEGNILMSTMYFYDEVNIPEAIEETKYSKQELDLAMKLIDNLSGHFKPEEYVDENYDNLKKVVDAKIDGKKVPKKKSRKHSTTKDLLVSLQKSLEN